jgi:OFA family oxalate/formate antiporter-like MFS transporter
MVPSSLYIAPPPPGYSENYFKGGSGARKEKFVNVPDVSAMDALKTPGFYGLWIMLFINVSCGIAVIATAKKMGYEMVRLSVEMSTLLVMGISLFNGIGRILWASLSDYIGRANTYVAFFAIQMIAFPMLAYLTTSPLLFMIVTFIILTCYGGGFASIPAYISDLFGLDELPTIHGFILTAWSLAGIVGPMLNAYIYEQTQSYQQSLYIFGGAFVLALAVALLMKVEMRRVRKRALFKSV